MAGPLSDRGSRCNKQFTHGLREREQREVAYSCAIPWDAPGESSFALSWHDANKSSFAPEAQTNLCGVHCGTRPRC